MYIENSIRGRLLSKKIWGRKISVKIGESPTFQDMDALKLKEVTLFQSSPEYLRFSKELYDVRPLEKTLDLAVLVRLIRETDTLRLSFGEKDTLHATLAHVQTSTYRDFAKIFIYESNKTEWSKIPYEELEKIIDQKKSRYFEKNEVREVINSIQVWDYIQKEFIFNTASIKKAYHLLTHELLQENGSPYPRGFKKISVVVNDERTTPPDQVEIEMKKLIEWYRREKGNIFPFQMAFEWHLRFEKIHPFENGNGRIGRFLMNKILISYGFPPMVLFSSNRQAYFNAIASTRDGRRQKYYTFMLESYLKSLLFFSQKK